MATQVPARLLGRDDLGRLAAGCAADLVLWSASMEVEATYIGGTHAFRSSSGPRQGPAPECSPDIVGGYRSVERNK